MARQCYKNIMWKTTKKENTTFIYNFFVDLGMLVKNERRFLGFDNCTSHDCKMLITSGISSGINQQSIEYRTVLGVQQH